MKLLQNATLVTLSFFLVYDTNALDAAVAAEEDEESAEHLAQIADSIDEGCDEELTVTLAVDLDKTPLVDLLVHINANWLSVVSPFEDMETHFCTGIKVVSLSTEDSVLLVHDSLTSVSVGEVH